MKNAVCFVSFEQQQHLFNKTGLILKKDTKQIIQKIYMLRSENYYSDDKEETCLQCMMFVVSDCVIAAYFLPASFCFEGFLMHFIF